MTTSHTLPRGADIIEALTRLGTALGYVAEKERPVARNRSRPPAVDVAWLSERGQEYPLMIFEIESFASNTAANNPVKVFGQPNERFEKPLFYFHVFVTAGSETGRIDTLRHVFGTHNYRAYRLDQDGVAPLLNDILSQHRRLHRQIDLSRLFDELQSAAWRSVVKRDLLKHVEGLGFMADYLGECARRALSDIELRSEYLRILIEAMESPFGGRLSARYGTYIGDSWAAPIHIGLLALAFPGREDWLERLRNWQERSSYLSMIGPHFGLSRDYDSFVLGLAPVLWSLVAALMYKIRGASEYICDQLLSVLKKFDDVSADLALFTAIWALHIAVATGSEERYERARMFINSRDGVAPDVLYMPPSLVIVDEPDDQWPHAIARDRAPVPTASEFRKILPSHYARTCDTDEDLFRLALDVLTRDAAQRDWSAATALLLHAPAGLTAKSAVQQGGDA